MSVITKFETWVCTRPEVPGSSAKTSRGEVREATHGSQYVVIRLTTDDGVEGIATSIASRPSIARSYIDDIIAPVVLGRDVHDREAIWHDLYQMNRRVVFFPVFLPGPVDVALWDIAAKLAGPSALPLSRCVPGQASCVREQPVHG